MKTDKLLNYLRIDRWPTVWCPGCGNGIVLKSLIDAIDQLNLEKDRVAVVSGIGCSSRATGYLDFNTMHTLHGRAIAFATGVKLARPDFKVIVLGGDGDLTAIGGNHFIHAARRNMDLTVVLFNNMIYGMTGGQHSPTTPFESIASTMPYGNIENSFDVVELATSAGATYVARSTIFHYQMSVNFIKKGILHRGLSVIEILTNCHTYYGRYNNMKNSWEFLEFFKKNTVLKEKAQEMKPEDLKDKIIIGEFRNEEKPDFYQRYKTIFSNSSEV